MAILEKGYLLENKNTEKECVKEYVMKVIGTESLDAIMELQEVILNTIPIKEIFAPDSREELIHQINNGGLIVGTFVEEKLVAYRYVSFPREHQSNLGVDLSIKKEELNLVANLETTVVHPDFRGNRLQWKTLGNAIEIIKDRGYMHLCTTISPRNPHSMSNIMAHDLVIKKIKRKYGTKPDQSDGVLRYILHRDLKITQNEGYENEIEVDSENVFEQTKLLQEGFVGYKLSNTTGRVVFAKEKLCQVESLAI